jgi:hypothetical protein
MASLFTGGKFQAINASGVVPGAKLHTYAAGTTTPLATYTLQDGASPNANPVICNAAGQASVWLGTSAYRMILKDASDVTIWDVDNITTDNFSSTTSATGGAGAIGFNPELNYAAATVGWAFKESEWSVGWFPDVVGDGVADDTAAVAAIVALKTAAGGGSIFFPRTAGGYLFSGTAGDTLKNGILLPFTVVNPDHSTALQLRGEAGTVFKAGSDTMAILRISRNCVTTRDIIFDGNGHTGVYGRLVGPESMTQTTTQVSQQHITSYNCHTQDCAEGLVIQPGPQVSGSDSGCFYMDFYSDTFDTCTRAVYLKKNADWATHPNRPTRINFFGCRIKGGNTGYYMEVGSEISLHGCNEELIAAGSSPLATPTARYITADCSNIRFFGGYSEACSASTELAAFNLSSFGYIPASGSTTTWRAYAKAYEDEIDTPIRAWTPVVNSSGGGAEGSGTSSGWLSKTGRLVAFGGTISVLKGTLGAGNITITGFPILTNTSSGVQWAVCQQFSTFTFSNSANTVMSVFVNAGGATLNLRKSRNDGGADTSVTVAEAGATISFAFQGTLVV